MLVRSINFIHFEIHFRDLRPFWRKLGELGAHGITVKSEYGGSDGNYLDHVIVMEELSRYDICKRSVSLSILTNYLICLSIH